MPLKIVRNDITKMNVDAIANAPLSKDWSEDINADYQRRGKKNKN